MDNVLIINLAPAKYAACFGISSLHVGLASQQAKFELHITDCLNIIHAILRSALVVTMEVGSPRLYSCNKYLT